MNGLTDERLRLCPTCGQRTLEPRTVRDEFSVEVEGRAVAVVAEGVPVEVCTNCGETLSGPTAGRKRHAAIVRTLGVLTPEEIIALRGRFGMSQEQFAVFSGIGVDCLARWERASWIQTPTQDRLLRNLDELRLLRAAVDAVPEAQRKLEALRAAG